jgi:hypothetical protein
MPANGKPNGRFELPSITPVNYSLTDGTNIPPPPDSPIEEAPPPAPKPEPAGLTLSPENAATNANGFYDGRGRTSAADKPPLSPASTKRPSSIRRFLSRKSLNANYTNGTNHNGSQEELAGIERPESSLSFASGRPSLIKKTSGSWFRRLGGTGGGNRTSVVYENNMLEEKVPMGPPPPKLPELNQLKAKIADDDEGSLGGGDMFKNIK